jgi:hypothetical protein
VLVRTIGFIGLVLAAGVPLAAAQDAQLARQREELKLQVYNFEGLLRTAVQLGGTRLMRAATKVNPDVHLELGSDPVVRGFPHPEGGFVFYVEVPDILHTPRLLMERLAPRPPVGAVPATETVRVPARFDPDQEYKRLIYDALVDAILDNSGGLPLGATGRVVVTASVFQSVLTNVASTLDYGKLILSIKSEDLLAYRQGKITRDDAKLRIIDQRF